MPVKYWKQKNGVKILIKDMTDDHIKNTIAMLERNYSKECINESFNAMEFAISTGGEMASCAAENASDDLLEEAERLERIEDWEKWPQLNALQKELERRHDKN